MVGLQQAPGIRLALIQGHAIDEIAAVDGHLAAIHHLRVAASGLGVLPGDAAQVDHARAAAVGDEHGHLQQHAQLVLDDGAAAVREGLGAVAALEEETLPRGGLGHQAAQVVHFLGHHQGRQLAQLRQHGLHGRGVAVARLLGRGQAAPGIGSPGPPGHRATSVALG